MRIKSVITGFTTLAALSALSIAASALPIGNPVASGNSEVQNVRQVCDASGKCWRESNIHGYGYNPAAAGATVAAGGMVKHPKKTKPAPVQ